MKNEIELLQSKELRDKLASRIEVLEKVKQIITIPQTQLSTIKQVSEYYEVDERTIERLFSDNKDEIESDGSIVRSLKDFKADTDIGLKSGKGKTSIIYKNGEILDVPSRGLRVFSGRAILRIGMLLTGSEISKRVRTALLDIEEKAPEEIKVLDINEEQKLMLEIGMAVASGNATAVAIASSNLIAFKNRHINKLEQSNKALANGILEWEDRSRINFAVRKLAQTAHIQYGQLWNDLYKQLKNKYHMDLKARGKQPWIQHVEEYEWNNVIKSFSALCAYYNQSPADMFCDLKVSEV